MSNGYTQTIIDASRQLSAKEKVAIKHLVANKLDEVVDPTIKLIFKPVSYAVMQVHNENSENKDYNVYLIEDSEGEWYSTGSSSFWDTFLDIWTDMDGEEFDLVVMKRESKNYRGKYFLTCNIQ